MICVIRWWPRPSATKELKERGVRDVIILGTHGLFSEPAFERLNSCDTISKVVVMKI